MPVTDFLRANEIQSRVVEQSRKAVASEALVPLETSVHTLEDQGVPFIVRIAHNLKEKIRATKENANTNPFLPPYEADLYLGDVSSTHAALLNKFCVLDGHLLLVTREHAPQTELLSEADCEALLLGLAGVDGLAFYNGGTEAGASQPHKHLQLVPLPLAEGHAAVPLEPMLSANARPGGRVTHNPDLPFSHAVAAMPENWLEAPEQAAGELRKRYLALWSALGYELTGDQQPMPYNLLATRKWLWLVPRSREKYNGLAANALGYAGALMVLDEDGLERLRELGPMRLLAELGIPAN